MGLLKQRPEIQLRCPREVIPGETFRALVLLECPAPLPINGVSATLTGTAGYASGQAMVSQFCRGRQELRGAGELAAGVHELETSFRLRSGMPGSYVGAMVRIDYQIQVHVDIPWWPDARPAYLLRVIGQGNPAPNRRYVFVSRKEGPRGTSPYIEVSIDTTAVEPGDRVLGQLALANVANNDYRAVEIELVAHETMQQGFARRLPVRRWTLPVREPAENEPIPFAIDLPNTLVPQFNIHGVALRWYLKVTGDTLQHRDPTVEIPISVVPPALAGSEPEVAPLAVGSARLERVWTHVAQKTGFELREGSLHGEAHGASIDVRREHRGRHGLFVVARATYPDLGVGMELGRRWRSVELTARDGTHQELLREALGEALANAKPDHADDDEMVWELNDRGLDHEALLGFIGGIVPVLSGLDAARQRLQAPVQLSDRVADFEEAADMLGGTLIPAAMAVRIVRDEVSAQLRPAWDPHGEPIGLELEVQPPMPIDGRHQVDWGAGGSTDLPEAIEESGISATARWVVVDGRSITVEVELPPGGLTDAVNCLQVLIELARRLSGRGGGYR